MRDSISTRRLRHGSAGGFSLIELMIVVAIIAILSAIALPAYQNSILKGRRAEGRAAVLDMMTRQERYNTQTGSYCLTANTCASNFRLYSGDGATSSAAYRLSTATCTGSSDARSCIQVVATPVRADPEAGNLTMLSTGNKSCDGTKAPAICW